MESLQTLLKRSARNHDHLCPRQVLGVRMGMLAGTVLDLDLPQKDKRLFTFAEADGCGTGGIAVATGCFIERRTLRVMDFGKMAGTFVDTQTGQAVRITPRPGSRDDASQYSPDSENSWYAQLEAYQVMPDELLFTVQPVRLTVSLEKIISRDGLRESCSKCGEEITNEREVIRAETVLCRGCAGEAYYKEIQGLSGGDN